MSEVTIPMAARITTTWLSYRWRRKSVTVRASILRATIANFFPRTPSTSSVAGTCAMAAKTHPYPHSYPKPGPPMYVPALAALARSVKTRMNQRISFPRFTELALWRRFLRPVLGRFSFLYVRIIAACAQRHILEPVPDKEIRDNTENGAAYER